MAKLTSEEIIHLSAVLAAQKLDTGNDMEVMCQQMQEDYLKIRDVFIKMNKDDAHFSTDSLGPRRKR